MTLVIRDDLSQRTVLSKSALTTFEWCQQQAWFDIHDRKPMIPNERASFGSSVDAAVEQVIKGIQAGAVDLNVAMAAAQEVVGDNEVGVDLDEVEKAASRFVIEVAGHKDFTDATTQPNVIVNLPDLGEISTHPDIVYADGSIDDVKTAKQAKQDNRTLELGFYGLAVEAFTGQPVPTVGYLTWTRTSKPRWQMLTFLFTDEYKRWARERAGAYVRAKKADEVLNRNAELPRNFSFPGGPAFAGLCDGCQYNPANGGGCAMALQEEVA
jgi:hypothetical protein